MPAKRFVVAPVVLVCVASVSFADPPVDYLRDIKPILTQHCLSCHGAKVTKGKLRVDTAALLRRGGASGSPIVPGKASESLLIDAVKGANSVTQMPYKQPALTAKQIQLLTAWIDQGAKAPANELAEGGSSHWAFQAPKRPPLPPVKDTQWVQNPIDHFILARLEKDGIKPAPAADRVTLMRRVYLDLLGLPPTPEEIATYLADTKPQAYEWLVDRLLHSPHYGERWGRHWLDLARYADTHGFTIDAPREIWKYRDWVIDAMNSDMPFDRFVIEQMAGDMLPKASLAQRIATGFHRNTLVNQEGGIDVEQFRVEAVADRVNTVGTIFLGLTLGCARCHDHKYDPISQREYFQLFAFLNNQSEPTLNLSSPEIVAKREAIQAQLTKMEDELDERVREFVKKLADAERSKLKQDITVILNLRPDQRTEAQKKTLATHFRPMDAELKKRFDQLTALKKQEPKFPTTMVLAELAKPRATHIHISGDFTRKGEKVGTAVPGVLHSLANAKPQAANRLDLARWLVEPSNPLLGRVTMNRLWQRYFGKGIVETENDFGLQATPPTHPELLDWLAMEFVGAQSVEREARSANQDGAPRSTLRAPRTWSLKAMHRLIVTSATYRQSSRVRPELAELDPHNKLLARQNRLRLDAEVVRDNALAASGLLSRKIGGPSVFPPQPEGVYQFTQVQRSWKTSTGPDRYRRGLYTFLQRSAPYPALSVFDAPDGNSSCTRRIRSNTPLQALTLLNDPAFLELAKGLAGRVRIEATSSDAERLRFAFRTCLAREPGPSEAQLLHRYLLTQLDEYRAAPEEARALLGLTAGAMPADVTERAAWTALARVLLNLDEFITRE